MNNTHVNCEPGAKFHKTYIITLLQFLLSEIYIFVFFFFPWGSPEPQSFGPNFAFFREALAILFDFRRGMGMDFGLQTDQKLVGRQRDLNPGPP